MKIQKTLIVSAIALALGACSDDKDKETDEVVVTLDEEIRALIDSNQLTAAPEEGVAIPSIDSKLAQLGKKLFFSKSLSGQKDTACVTCHHPRLGGGDRLALSIGVDAKEDDFLGPGRLHDENGFHHDGGPTVPRNAPSTFNIALYEKSIFHDGRIEILADGGIRTPDATFDVPDTSAVNLAQAQAMFPVTSKEEMRGLVEDGNGNAAIRGALTARLTSQEIGNTWLDEFQTAFESAETAEKLITMQNISFAIGEYERSQLFVNNPWRAYVNGDNDAITETAKKGAKLFYTSVTDGGAGCSGCHSGDFFSDEEFHVVAMPQIGRGKGNGETGDDDFGRFRETGVEKDKYAFRTPTLLNAEVTLPYGHAGAYSSLYEVIKHHVDPAEAIASYNFSTDDIQPGLQLTNAKANTEKALAALQALQTNGESKLVNSALSDEQVNQLVAFVKTLTDPCVLDDECLQKWVPADDEADPDNLRLVPSNYFTASDAKQ